MSYNKGNQERICMKKQRRVFTKEFKLDAVRYRKDHPELTVKECSKNLDIGASTLQRWISESSDESADFFRGSGNYESDQAKELARIKKENRDLRDALEVLKKAIGILGE